ncbi:MAG: hypothetical protein OQL19_15520 [Gammaproteobacteria bacterium]|nr:hypothetical protein [Gammaproteobacteria bacterium]
MSIFFNIIKLSIFSLSLMSAQFLLAASEDDYLKQLEMEADVDNVSESPSFLESQGADNSTLDAPSNDSELINDKKELINDLQTFEKALKGSYPESYELYQQLSDEQKNLIYQDFTNNKRLYNSSVKIISVYLGTH